MTVRILLDNSHWPRTFCSSCHWMRTLINVILYFKFSFLRLTVASKVSFRQAIELNAYMSCNETLTNIFKILSRINIDTTFNIIIIGITVIVMIQEPRCSVAQCPQNCKIPAEH